MLRVGLTGGIASGKSAAAAEFARLGATIVDADEAARKVTAPGAPALQELAALVPDEPIVTRGILDRRRLRQLVFQDANLRQRVEAILHPRIVTKMKAEIAAAKGDYVIVAIPLLVETGTADLLDRVLVVDAPEALQIRRLMQRDGETEAEARRILAAQAGREARLALADDVIDNNGSMTALQAAVRALHERYTEMSGH
ncbi:MAG TPA: dephospho-CoA kinase [Gammaproteobacteria bacterium]|nr:dephospho-CoA kinase [Gammaproteobacteria bacterium]